MENSFQTSFIPKKPITTTTTTRSTSTGLFTFISVALLVLVGLTSGGLFIYKNYLSNQEKKLSDSLQKVRASFEKDTIAELELYDKRARLSKQILSGHVVLSPLFALLGELTIPSIQYTKFDHQMDEKGFSVKISGTARDYKSIALQAQAFNSAKGRSFKNVVFSNLTKDVRNNVTFELEFMVDPALLSYEKNNILEGRVQLPAQSTTGDKQLNQNKGPGIPATNVTEQSQ